MAQPYSDDSRQKVMQAIELDGLKKSEASQLFNISRNTINLWCQRKAETGDVKPKPRQVSQQNLKINDWEKFQDFVKTHRDKTQSEMAQLWPEEISQLTISRALRNIKQTRKKNIRVSPKRRSQTSNLLSITRGPQSPSQESMSMSRAWMNGITMATGMPLLGNASTILNPVGGRDALIWLPDIGMEIWLHLLPLRGRVIVACLRCG